jgi:hypothetical protein
MTMLRTLAFGDLGERPWGVAWTPESGEAIALAARANGAAAIVTEALEGGADGEPWILRGDGGSLEFSPLARGSAGPGLAGAVRDGPADEAGFDQLCAVTGHLLLAGAEYHVECLGLRSLRSARELERIQSFRQVSAWFDPEHGIALLALRPVRAKGQDADRIAASLLDADELRHVAESRLSTTYAASGAPTRAGLELWLEDRSSEALEGDRPQYPRRAAGEGIGDSIDWTTGGFELHARRFRWHSRGSDGAGIYLLGRRP